MKNFETAGYNIQPFSFGKMPHWQGFLFALAAKFS
jgi:hypothetical protein